MPATRNLVGVGRHRGSPGSMSGGGGVSDLVTRDLLARQSLQTLRPRPATLRRHSGGPRRGCTCHRCRRSSPSTRHSPTRSTSSSVCWSWSGSRRSSVLRPGPVGARPRPRRLLGSGADPADHRSDDAGGRRCGRPHRVPARAPGLDRLPHGEIAQTSGGRLRAGMPVDVHAVPVSFQGRVITVVEQHTSRLGVRRQAR